MQTGAEKQARSWYCCGIEHHSICYEMSIDKGMSTKRKQTKQKFIVLTLLSARLMYNYDGLWLAKTTDTLLGVY